jgi:hypothetical protein
MKKILLLVLIALVILFPTLASFPPFKQLFLKAVELRMHATIKADKLRLSWLGPQQFEGVRFSTPELDGAIQEMTLNKPFWNMGSLPYDLSLTTAQIEVKDQPLSLTLTNALIQNQSIQATGTTKGGSFRLKGTAQDSQNFNLQFSGTNIPTAPVAWLLHTDLLKIIGPQFSCDATIHDSNDAGSLSIELTSPKARLSLHGKFTPDVLTLTQPLHATFSLPPELTTAFFKKPTAFWDPITLDIDPKDFSYPRKFSLSKLQIGNGVISPGRVSLVHPQTMQSLAAWLKNPALYSPNQLDLWLTCCPISLHQGSLDFGRVDALVAEQLHLAAWGNINLLTDRVNATLGLPAGVLAKNFGIQGLSSNYLLQVPVTGTLENPQVDTSTGGTKIAALIASQVAKSTPSQVGQIFGTVVSGVTQVAQPPTPPPCQTPFPWQR